jgi:hypothetical protein
VSSLTGGSIPVYWTNSLQLLDLLSRLLLYLLCGPFSIRNSWMISTYFLLIKVENHKDQFFEQHLFALFKLKMRHQYTSLTIFVGFLWVLLSFTLLNRTRMYNSLQVRPFFGWNLELVCFGITPLEFSDAFWTVLKTPWGICLHISDVIKRGLNSHRLEIEGHFLFYFVFMLLLDFYFHYVLTHLALPAIYHMEL